MNDRSRTSCRALKVAASEIELVAALGFLELEILGGTLDEIEVSSTPESVTRWIALAETPAAEGEESSLLVGDASTPIRTSRR